jgi:membrane fusion protein (multidrug efflux system)
VLRGAQRKDALAVPQIALLDGPQGKFVYVAGKDKDGKDVAEVRQVTLGAWVDVDGTNQWIVESGLKAGETVLVEGIAKLQPGAAIALGGSPGDKGGTPPKDAAPAAPTPKN